MSERYFMLKYNFYNDNINQYSKVKLITIINMMCLIEDIKTKNREWVMRTDIYPIKDHDVYGFWKYDQYFQNIVMNNNYT